MSIHIALPARRNHITQKVRIVGRRTLYMSVHDDERPAEIAGARIEPCGPVSWRNRLKHCSSVPDLIGRHLLVKYCERDDVAHAQPLTTPKGS